MSFIFKALIEFSLIEVFVVKKCIGQYFFGLKHLDDSLLGQTLIVSSHSCL